MMMGFRVRLHSHSPHRASAPLPPSLLTDTNSASSLCTLLTFVRTPNMQFFDDRDDGLGACSEMRQRITDSKHVIRPPYPLCQSLGGVWAREDAYSPPSHPSSGLSRTIIYLKRCTSCRQVHPFSNMQGCLPNVTDPHHTNIPTDSEEAGGRLDVHLYKSRHS
ncbi:uncharacterized protein LAESUDRAFT_732699 [Laetiporus sulphureus 93-53]|uniref:Uncharacterized protein n=1 Tax=Laetiporus sulphureus 93-53 TaxID=1314785 RepID=A0A165B0F9_9APHY|nr:uncharacterized protein LAESUDRAFT_732699 [Laetiporus sulphureus 93-53]KZS99994.1 hypothetical protein LAESUDRAFT_732699 [Laetiporus sulphureus 93-53]